MRVRHLANDETSRYWIFDGRHLSLRNFDAPAEMEPALQGLAQVIEQGFPAELSCSRWMPTRVSARARKFTRPKS